MAWVKIDDNFPDHPKAIRVGFAGLLLQIKALCYASRHLTDGFLPSKVVASLLTDFDQWFREEVTAASTLPDEMVESGLWERTDGGYVIHDYLEYNPSKRQVLSTRRKRQASGKQGGLRSGQARRKHGASHLLNPRPVPSRPLPGPSRSPSEETKQEPPITPQGVNGFEAFWSRYPKQEGYGKAQEAWNKYAKAIPLDTILAGIARWEVSQKWADGYVPMPATWLNQKRWKDNPKPGRKQFVTAQEIWDQAQEEKPNG